MKFYKSQINITLKLNEHVEYYLNILLIQTLNFNLNLLISLELIFRVKLDFEIIEQFMKITIINFLNNNINNGTSIYPD